MTGSKRSRWLKLFTLLAVMMILAAACGEDATETEPTDDTGSSPSETEAPEFSTLEEGILQVGSCLDYRPFEFVKDGDEQGFDVELTEEIASRLGLEVEWVTANFDTIFTSVAAGQFDMVAAASTITDERLQAVDFSDGYFNARQGFTVNVDATPDITSTDQLGEGDVVAVQKGTTGKSWAEENLAPNGVEIKSFDAVPAAFTDLEAGNVVGVINDEGSSIAEASERPGLQVVQAIDTDELYGLAFSKDNPELTAAVNGALAEVIADGTYAAIFSKWFPDLPVPEEYAAS
ncbi:MAG: transporter substrate-binding domain-containing protein [Actinobacteria bacterium]|nr:transporter substrate-binding domain-containing protein [Actinomycetota bacterium]